jgi:hypothetical protein
MDFVTVLQFLFTSFKKEEVDFAFIGGFALQAAGVTRATQDVDFLILAQDAAKIKKTMLAGGYELLHESQDTLNFLGKRPEMGRVDFILAHRKHALEMLKRARIREGFGGRYLFKVLIPEDLIGLKVQAIANSPHRREKDIPDIRALLNLHRTTMDMELVRDYFQIFEMEPELEKLVVEASHAPES